ncbi:MAG: preprotein translocase subunit YajC [Xanthobacteraceae bacterium]
MFITPAFAQSNPLSSLFGGGGDSASMITSFMPLILIVVIMYFLILRPQQRKVKLHQEMVKALRRGDTVVTNGGLIGKVTKVVDDSQVEVEIADGVRVRHLRSSISEVRAKSEPVKDDSAS